MTDLRLGIMTSHPIQYQAPLFRALAARVDLEVFFAHRQEPEGQAAAGYGVSFDWDVDLLSGYRHQFLDNRARQPGVDRFGGTNVPAIRESVARGGFDAFVVMGWHLRAYWQAILACRRIRVPVFVRGESQLETRRSLAKRLTKEALHRWIVRQFDGLLYIGARNRDYLTYYGADPARMFFSPYCVDGAWFRRKAEEAGSAGDLERARLGIAADEHVILFVGRLVPMKRVRDLVAALRLLRMRGSPLRLVVVGDGPLHQELTAAAAGAGCRIDFVGFQNQSRLPLWYVLADLLVLPSDAGETWGLVVNEAMASGTPAVVSDAVGCAPDLIDEGATGRTFPLGDVDALANAVAASCSLKHRPATREALARKSAAYSIERAVAGILDGVEAVRPSRSRAA